MKGYELVLTCEHAGNQIPKEYLPLFTSATADLKSHLGWDPGALAITQNLAECFQLDYQSFEVSRLLIEVNRSLGNAQVFSKYSNKLSEEDKNRLIQTYYQPYRGKVMGKIQGLVDQGKKVVHLSVHTFTPVFDQVIREVEIGLLFDENRNSEKDFCEEWKETLQDYLHTTRLNEPYKGSDDGFTTMLRTKFNDEMYLGLELEVSQKFVGTARFEEVKNGISQTLSDLIL